MKRSRNSFTIILMLSSIALLLVLQFLWLKSSYNKAFEDLRKETNSLFRTTLFAMRDSIIQRTIEPVPGDTTFHKFFRRRRPYEETIDTFKRGDKTAQVQVMITSTQEGDSLVKVIKPLATKFLDERGGRNFIFRLGPDSLKADSIVYHFKAALKKAGINLPFVVLQVKRGERPTSGSNSIIISEPVRINPINRYAVSVSEIQGKIIREIVPQILFSFFLTFLTLGAFYVLYRSIRTQQRLVDLKNDFINNITHELKTPITTVSVAIEALQDFKGLSNPQLVEEYLGIAQSELKRLTFLTDKILKTAIFESNGVTYEPVRTDIKSMISQILASMKPVFEKGEVALKFETRGTGFEILGGPDHLANVFYNLLDNALKYNLPPPSISILLEDLGDKIRICIADTGVGIAPEYQRKIYEKFFRVPTGDVHNIKGYGLGLSYVDRVIRSHQGSIELQSSLGKGSCFMITLPKG